jgi:hypothetical protein
MYVPLNIPPGVVRPGTLYDARGRWYDANLIRWIRGADPKVWSMLAVGGWQVMERTVAVAVSAYLSDDGGVFTTDTTDANDADADDFTLLPATPVVGDAAYFAYPYRFTEVEINVGTGGVGNAVTWEYWNGSAWTALEGAVDNTNAFATTGTNGASWDLPWDWEKNTVNALGPFYWVRARCTTAGASGATGTQAWIGTGPVDIDEAVRGMYAWRTNDGAAYLFLGSPTKAFAFAQGVLADITPVGFTTGGADAVLSGGAFGSGAFGAGPFGVGDLAQETLTEANTWQVDNFGEDLVACAYSDGDIHYWDKSAGGAMAQLTNSPSDCVGVVVTPERFIVALGAGGDPRLLAWCDQENSTVWTVTPNNQAGDWPLQGKGSLMAGRRGKTETMIWTDVDFFVMRYVGGPFAYRVDQKGAECGAISRRSMAVRGNEALWMGRKGFFYYNGEVSDLPCDVADYVFNDMNELQASKIYCETRAEFGETTWYYCSASSTEIDRYVVFSKAYGWNIGELPRTAGVDRDAFSYPIAADPNGVLYRHEIGSEYRDPDGEDLTPRAESGPFEIGNGDQVMTVNEFVPDERSLGDAQVTLYAALKPTTPESTHGPYALEEPTSVRVTARQVRVKLEQVNPGWRWGTPRLDVIPGGRR